MMCIGQHIFKGITKKERKLGKEGGKENQNGKIFSLLKKLDHERKYKEIHPGSHHLEINNPDISFLVFI